MDVACRNSARRGLGKYKMLKSLSLQKKVLAISSVVAVFALSPIPANANTSPTAPSSEAIKTLQLEPCKGISEREQDWIPAVGGNNFLWPYPYYVNVWKQDPKGPVQWLGMSHADGVYNKWRFHSFAIPFYADGGSYAGAYKVTVPPTPWVAVDVQCKEGNWVTSALQAK